MGERLSETEETDRGRDGEKRMNETTAWSRTRGRAEYDNLIIII